jgi:hypothetical protein
VTATATESLGFAGSKSLTIPFAKQKKKKKKKKKKKRKKKKRNSK